MTEQELDCWEVGKFKVRLLDVTDSGPQVEGIKKYFLVSIESGTTRNLAQPFQDEKEARSAMNLAMCGLRLGGAK